MKIRNIISAITAVTAAAVLTLGAGAYTLDKDLGMGWSSSITIPGSEFECLGETPYITITYTVDTTLADMPGQEYWCIKTMINDEGWPFIDNISELELSEGKDSYVIGTETSEITFTIPEDKLEHVQIAGLAIMGHGITLHEMTFSADAPAVETPVVDAPAAETPAKGNPDTGVEGIGAAVAAASAAAAALAVSRKRK